MARLVDTSVAVPLVLVAHEHHDAVSEAVGADRGLGLAGHAAIEAYSVLTRLPGPSRRTPASVRRLLRSAFPGSLHLPDGSVEPLLDELPRLGIAGGAVYDALVGATARHHQVPLLTRDRRALTTYDALGVDVEVIG